MSRFTDLAHVMVAAQNKSALLYGMGEYDLGDHWARVAQNAQDEIERMDNDAVVREIGVS